MFKVAEKEVAADLESALTIYNKAEGVFEHPAVMKKIGLTFTLKLENKPDYSRGGNYKVYSLPIYSEETPCDESKSAIQDVLDLV